MTVGPPAGTDLYEGGAYAPPHPRVDRLLEPLRRAALATHVRALRLPTGATVLEIGAGDGRLLEALARRGHAVAGIEPSSAARRARARGLDVREAALEDVDLPPGSVDAVVLWHVLEHLSDPGAALAAVVPALRPGGRVVVAVPNLDGLQARLGRDRWFHQDVPRHATHFTARGVERLLARRGLIPVRRRALVLDQDLLGMAQTLLNLATRERDVGFRMLKGARPSRRDAVATALLLPAATIAALVAEPVAAATGAGGTLVVEGLTGSVDRVSH
ncbi:MAG: class I SAM-dependent methyltransferase [Pseudomonadota bacterium]